MTDAQLLKATRLVRSGRRGDQRIVTYGKAVCASCGHQLPTLQVAGAIGVTGKQLTAFLNHGTSREDVVAKIRAAVAEVDE